MAKAFFYALGSNGNTSSGRITGIPAQCGETVFMGFCKSAIRSAAIRGDWIIAISNSKIKPRWILSMIQVRSRPKLYKARKNFPEAIWSPTNPTGQIWVEPIGKQDEMDYRYIPGAPHDESRKENDFKKYPNTDRLIVGTANSVILGEQGIPINNRILAIMKKDAKLKSVEIDLIAPFGKVLRKKKGGNEKELCCAGRPQPAIVNLNTRDIEYLKQLEKTSRKTLHKTIQPLPEGTRGCIIPRRKMTTVKLKRRPC